MKYQKKMTIAAIATALMASLAPMPAKSTVVQTISNAHRGYSKVASVITLDLSGDQVFIPLSQATEYVNYINDVTRENLRCVIEERIAKAKGDLVEDVGGMIKAANENIEQCQRIRKAIKSILTNENLHLIIPDEKKREELKSNLIKFGRVVATSEFLSSDVISAIKQSRPPEKTSNEPLGISSEQLKDWIRAEHRSLGLSPPVFTGA